MLNNVELFSYTEPALATDETPLDMLQDLPPDAECFTTVFQLPNMLSKLTRLRVDTVVDTLVVYSQSFLECIRGQPNIWPHLIVRKIDNITAVDNVTSQVQTI